MPLINSTTRKALGENIAIEERAGREPKQAEAIAFSVRRKLMAKKKKRRA